MGLFLGFLIDFGCSKYSHEKSQENYPFQKIKFRKITSSEKKACACMNLFGSLKIESAIFSLLTKVVANLVKTSY